MDCDAARQIFRFFPQLRESEDERIRKELVNFILYKTGHLLDEDTEHKFVAYLEKQKEQKKSLSERFRPDFPSVADFIERVDELEKNNAMKEQKPAEWDELQADFRNINEAFEDGKKEVIAHPEKYDLCKPAEWSEEDEKIITRLIGYFESFRIAGVATKWEGLDIQEVITLLKSLRNRPKSSDNWKPSEEQMKALQRAIDACESEWAYQDDELRSLLNDLKKL